MTMRSLAVSLGAAAVLQQPFSVDAGRIVMQSDSNRSAMEKKPAPVAVADVGSTFFADAGTKFADVQDSVSDGLDVLNAYVGHKHVMTFIDFWTIFNNLQKILDVRGQKRTIDSFLITGEIFTSMEALMEIDRVFTKNLGIMTDGQKTWTCAQYGDFQRPALSFEAKGFFPGSTFTSYNMEMEKECLSELKSSLYFVRFGACALEKQAEKWAQTMAKDAKDKSFWKELLQYNTRRTCRGPALDRKLLSSQLQNELIDEPDMTCAKHHGAVEECSAECARIQECGAVALDSKRRSCCFLTSNVTSRLRPKLLERPNREGDSCMQLTGRERFLMLDRDGAGQWLERHGFDEYKKQAEGAHGAGLTGMVLSFMTEPMLEKWLSSKDQPMTRAKELRCRIDAQLNNEPDRDCSVRAPGFFSKLVNAVWSRKGQIDNALVAPKGAMGRWRSVKWVLDFTRRAAPMKEVVAWSNTFYEIVAVALHAQKVTELVQNGYDSLKPMVMVKAAVSVTGIFKFTASTAFTKCQHVKSYLEPVVQQLTGKNMDMASQQKEHVAAQVARGS